LRRHVELHSQGPGHRLLVLREAQPEPRLLLQARLSNARGCLLRRGRPRESESLAGDAPPPAGCCGYHVYHLGGKIPTGSRLRGPSLERRIADQFCGSYDCYNIHMLAPLIAVLLLLVDSAAPSQSTGASAGCLQAAEKTADGRNLAAQKRYTQAIQEFRAALDQCPDNQDAALELTRVYLSARRFAEAERLASDILAHDPSSEAGQLLLANSYFMQQRFPEAGKTLQKLLAQNDRNVEAHKMMDLTLFFYKEYTLAERELARSLQLKPYDE